MSVFAGIERAERDLVVEDLIGRGRSWHHASPSQIKRYRECESAWFLESVHGFPRRETAATANGKAMHAELEAYLVEGKPPGALASTGLAFLPTPPVARDLVEAPFAILAPRLAPVVAKIDLIDPDRFATLVDHKSTSSISKYAKSEDELRADPQAIIYAVALAPYFAALAGGPRPVAAADYVTPRRPGREVETYPGVELALDALAWLPGGITFEHVYYQTKPFKSDRASVILSGADVRNGWQSVEADVRRMMSTASKAPHVSEVPHNLEACGRYGGCQFRKLCAGLGRRTMGVASAFFTDPGFSGTIQPVTEGLTTMGLMESLARRRADQGAASPSPATTPAAPAAAADPFSAGAAALEKMRQPAPEAWVVDDDDELERQLAERRAAKLAAKVQAEAEAMAAEAAAKEKARISAERVQIEADLEASRAAKQSLHPSINPPDGLPDGASLTAVEATDKASDPVVPSLPAVPAAFAGVRIRSIKKEGMIDLFVALRAATVQAGLSCPAEVAHLWRAPSSALPEAKRTAIKYAVEVALAMLQGRAIPAKEVDDGEAPAAWSLPNLTPPITPPTTPPITPPTTPPITPPTTPPITPPKTPPNTPAEVLDTPAPATGSLTRVLYVGCVPRRVPVVYLAEVMALIISAAETELGVQHYRIPAYKRGTDAVIARLAHALRSGEIVAPPALVVEVGLPLSMDALAELLPFYDLIVERMG